MKSNGFRDRRWEAPRDDGDESYVRVVETEHALLGAQQRRIRPISPIDPAVQRAIWDIEARGVARAMELTPEALKSLVSQEGVAELGSNWGLSPSLFGDFQFASIISDGSRRICSGTTAHVWS